MPPFHSRSTSALSIAFMSSVGVMDSASTSSISRTWGESGMDLAVRGKMPPLGDEALVVVSPRGAGEPEEALALLEALLGIGVGIEEDVHVVEGAHELYVTA